MVLAFLGLPYLAVAAPDTNMLGLAVDPDFQGGTGYNDQNISGVGPLSLSGSATGGFNSSGDGTSFVTYGIIELKGEFFGSGDTVSSGNYNDQFTISSPGIATGTQGTLTFAVSVAGLLQSLAGSSGAGFQLHANVNSAGDQINVSGSQYSPDLINGAYVGAPLGLFTATANFFYGVPGNLSVWLTGSAGAAYDSDPAMPEANFDLTGDWQGISDVLANGSAVNNFTVTSLSGVNYKNSFQAVPEPASFAPLALGLLCLRRRHS